MSIKEREMKAHSMNQEISPPLFLPHPLDDDLKPNSMRAFPTKNPIFSGVRNDKDEGLLWASWSFSQS
jgi:hypothetical protein